MMMHEFTERTGYTPNYDEYRFIEESYYEFDGNKDEFCKWWKKANKSGEWAKELKLRQRIAALEEQHKEDEKKYNETVEFYTPFVDRTFKAEKMANILKATAKETADIEIKGNYGSKYGWHRFSGVQVRYFDNGAREFINVIERSGWVSSIPVQDIEVFNITK